ncbi:MAG TPA: S8 family serine peptidase [Gaiellaceae bacterium]|jgi:serine protease AprX|nr:S8 family serine peptidase [Gaiellaceae bacterium]
MRHNLGSSAALLVTRRTARLALGVAIAILALVGASASRAAAGGQPVSAFVPQGLLSAAQADPNRTFSVVVQATSNARSADVASDVTAALLEEPGKALGVKRRFATIAGVSAQVTGKQLLKLATKKDVFAITEDAPVQLTGGLSSRQQWPFVSGVARGWADVTNGTLARPPAIAVVDSGIDAGRADFGGRVVKQVTMTSLTPNSPGDGRGHGTFVAGVAAGSAPGYTGAAPSAPIVSLDVMDDSGMAMTSDVIAAADWIYQNKAAYNIRVANFSLHATAPASVFFDPLDRAVERLWLSGVVVVAAAGNYGNAGQPTTMAYAPGNDPFVITVGADDIGGSVSTNDDKAAPWSVYGYTLDGFAKPELAAPGRYIVGPVPATSTLALERPASMEGTDYIQLSGTSFAAPVVAGAAAYLLAAHPTWTPDQVKGALMLTARPTPSAAPMSEGVGEVNAAKAVDVVAPPNPNAAIDRFLVPDPNGGSTPVFDAASWGTTARLDASWGTASWGTASWGTAAWSAASWGTASWSTASWGTASWGTASWGTSSWGTASWGTTSVADNATADILDAGSYWLDPVQEAEAEAELGVSVGSDGSVTTAPTSSSVPTTSTLP